MFQSDTTPSELVRRSEALDQLGYLELRTNFPPDWIWSHHMYSIDVGLYKYFFLCKCWSSFLLWTRVNATCFPSRSLMRDKKHPYDGICLPQNQEKPGANPLFHLKKITNALLGKRVCMCVCVTLYSTCVIS